MFNANEHMMQLKGKDYLQVAWRLVWFREEHPDWSVDASALELGEDHAIFKAVICDADGRQKSSGHGSESKRDFGDFIEKAETKAIGRALAMLGYGTQFAGNELDEGERIVDSPVDRGARETAPARKNEKPSEPRPEIKKSPTISGPEFPKAGDWNPRQAVTDWLNEHRMSTDKFMEAREAVIAAGLVENIAASKLTRKQAADLFTAIERNIA